MAIFIAESGHSTPDIVISVYLIVCCLISTSLNPVVFLYNYRRPNTTQRVVYRTLSLLDFTLCLLAPIMTVQNALKPTDCGGQNLVVCHPRPATTIEKMYTGVIYPCQYLPTILTAVLTTARLYHIRYPLRDPLHKQILSLLLVLCGLQTCFNVIPLFDTGVMWWDPMQVATNPDPFRIGGDLPFLWSAMVLMFPSLLAQILGLVATFLTITQMKIYSQDLAAQQSQRNNTKITKKILLTNTGSLIKMLISITYYILNTVLAISSPSKEVLLKFVKVGAWSNIVQHNLGPCLISAVNPIIFIAMTSNWRRGFRTGMVSVTLTN